MRTNTKNKIVVNLIGEPSVGKSSTAAGLFYELKTKGYNCELIQEVAKGYAWDSLQTPQLTIPHPVFGQQIFLLGAQNRLLQRVYSKVDIAIMECPLIMYAMYQPKNYFKSFEPLVLEQFNAYNNVNIFLTRRHPYQNEGRIHSENEAMYIRAKIVNFLNKHNIDCKHFYTSETVASDICKYILKKI